MPVRYLVIGLGITGVAAARHLCARGAQVTVADSRAEPPGLASFRDNLPAVPVHTGSLPDSLLDAVDALVVSPGMAGAALVQTARARGQTVLAELDLFARARPTGSKVVGITGTNGKSTVTTLVAYLLQAAGQRAVAGGNLAPPAVDLLTETDIDTFVLELSSFQLELATEWACDVAVVLNLSPDHLDRHGDMASYGALKRRIHRRCDRVVVNRQDPATWPDDMVPRQVLGFGWDEPQRGDFGVRADSDGRWLVRGQQRLLPVAELSLVGRHNEVNVLAALACVELLGVPVERVLGALRSFRGLPHRSEQVAVAQGVTWVNDSKATNIGACIAALDGLADSAGRVVLIAGGEGKGADFSLLRNAVVANARAVVLIGRDAELIAAALAGTVPLLPATDLAGAVAVAAAQAVPGDTVLLAPACASFDMFRSFEHRGDQFRQAVRDFLAVPAPSVAGGGG